MTAFLKRRSAVTAAMAVLTGAAAVPAALTFHALPVGALFLAAISLAAGAGATYVHLRHAGLAVLAAWAPLPGLSACAPLFDGVPTSVWIAAYASGAIAAGLAGAAAVRALLGGAERTEAARRALWALALPAFVTMTVAGAGMIGWLHRSGLVEGARAALVPAAALLSAILFLSLGAAVLPYSEAFFVRANRARDAREIAFGWSAALGEARWGLSVSGVVLVLGVVGWFGAAPRLDHWTILLSAGSALAVFAGTWIAGRDWRGALATTIAMGLLALIGVWLWERFVSRTVAAREVVSALAPAALLMLVLLGGAPAARLRALEHWSFALFAAPVAGAVAVLPWMLLHGHNAVLAAIIAIGGPAAAIALPALCTALETLIPRRRSVNELYGRG